MQGDQIDKRTDVFSLGVLLYEMISGSTPTPLPSIEAEVEVVREDPPLLDSIPTPAAKAVQRAMSGNPAARFQRAIDLVDEFENATGFKPGPFISVPDSPRSSPPPTLQMKAPRMGRQRLVPLIFTLIIIILGLTTLGVLAYLASKFLGTLGQTPPAIVYAGSAVLCSIPFMDIPHDKS
jgi:serine/threonine-protein kinase